MVTCSRAAQIGDGVGALRRRDAEGDAAAGAAAVEAEHEAGTFRRAAMHEGIDAERAMRADQPRVERVRQSRSPAATSASHSRTPRGRRRQGQVNASMKTAVPAGVLASAPAGDAEFHSHESWHVKQRFAVTMLQFATLMAAAVGIAPGAMPRPGCTFSLQTPHSGLERRRAARIPLYGRVQEAQSTMHRSATRTPPPPVACSCRLCCWSRSR